MKKQNFLKVFILSAAMVAGLLLPTSMSAQKSDGFFRGGETEIYENRESFVINGNDSEGGLSNYGIGEAVPVGSGLLVLSAAAAAYAFARRKRSRKGFAMFMACLMMLGFTQCKKKVVETANLNNAHTVNITLDVRGGEKVNVDPYWTTDPTYAKVDYEDGDKVYVGYNGLYVGSLIYSGETQKFSGSISVTQVDDEYLHFYFLGGQGFEDYFDKYIDEDEGDNKWSYVKISNQTERYPVISYAHSNRFYDGAGEYTAKLQNKCSIVKFNVAKTGSAASSSVTIHGVTNFIRIDFTDPSNGNNNGFSFFKGGDGGYITMSHRAAHTSEPNAYWAIMLPDDEVEEGSLGTVYTSDNYIGCRPEIPAISQNQYLDDGITITIDTEIPVNAFSVSPTKKVIFSPGNLQYNPSQDKWRFAENEWDYIGAQQSDQTNYGCTGGNVSGSDNYRVGTLTGYNGWLDLFGWGTGDKPTCIAHYYDKPTGSQNGYNGEYEWNIDWGENEIYDGDSPTDKTWFTLSEQEWEYLINDVAFSNSPREDKYGTATVNGAPGLVLLPDLFELPDGCSFAPGMVHDDDDNYNWQTWTVDDDNIYDAAEWALMSNAGAVFLPAAGSRVISKDSHDITEITFFRIGIEGDYWSTTDKSGWEDDDEEVWISNAANMHFTDVVDDYGDGDISVTGSGFKIGMSVRLVRDITSSDK